MSEPNTTTVTLKAHCLCKANTFETKTLESNLPLRSYTCNCTSCRHVTGALYISPIRWPEPRDKVHISNLKVFNFSPSIDLLFCSTCSTPIFWAWPKDEKHPLSVFTGALTNDTRSLIKISHQSFVGDTLDGGASVFFRYSNIDGTELKRFETGADNEIAKELPKQWPSPAELTGYEAKKEDAIPIRCKCKGIDFVLHRGDYSSYKEDELPWNIDPKTHKLLADLCGCDSCRLQSGVDVFCWTFAEMKYISFGKSKKTFPTHTDQLRKLIDVGDDAVGTLAYYTSSPNVHRFFCSTCSACVFYTKPDRPTFVDIAIGILEASDGARAEGMLSWDYGGSITYREDGEGGWREGLFEEVEESGEEYRVERDYPKIWKRLQEEGDTKKD
ncbi:hypothetical protein T440DRAFT_468547 [Plenodomus tracheiphilus IPT5]|uniref:CENP-V/GFA domain-containing protein n=1 Tax=Plenodomus tracheiphilus IPT5 TaxID=1408161 RepID=A0A6A7B5H4_9PLEO|nr:hypothetical protein T440DRAFT_468547 [Plenodomus tracheiphilus IPT5]